MHHLRSSTRIRGFQLPVHQNVRAIAACDIRRPVDNHEGYRDLPCPLDADPADIPTFDCDCGHKFESYDAIVEHRAHAAAHAPWHGIWSAQRGYVCLCGLSFANNRHLSAHVHHTLKRKVQQERVSFQLSPTNFIEHDTAHNQAQRQAAIAASSEPQALSPSPASQQFPERCPKEPAVMHRTLNPRGHKAGIMQSDRRPTNKRLTETWIACRLKKSTVIRANELVKRAVEKKEEQDSRKAWLVNSLVGSGSEEGTVGVDDLLATASDSEDSLNPSQSHKDGVTINDSPAESTRRCSEGEGSKDQDSIATDCSEIIGEVSAEFIKRDMKTLLEKDADNYEDSQTNPREPAQEEKEQVSALTSADEEEKCTFADLLAGSVSDNDNDDNSADQCGVRKSGSDSGRFDSDESMDSAVDEHWKDWYGK